MRNERLVMIVEAGIMIALAFILDNIKLFSMPYGGTVTAGSMIPILIFALRWGKMPGLMAGAVFGTMQFILGTKWSYHPISILFDYTVAWAALGYLAGMWKGNRFAPIFGVILAVLGRFACHVLSGVVVFSEYTPEGWNPLLYSMAYNGTYLGVELLIAVLVLIPLYGYLKSHKILGSK